MRYSRKRVAMPMSKSPQWVPLGWVGQQLGRCARDVFLQCILQCIFGEKRCGLGVLGSAGRARRAEEGTIEPFLVGFELGVSLFPLGFLPSTGQPLVV